METALIITVSVLVVLVFFIIILSLVRIPGILRAIQNENRQAAALIVKQLNEIIVRLSADERG